MRSSSFVLACSFLTGCLEGDVALFGCPPDEDCSDDTPNGLHFFGSDVVGELDLGNNATAVGGIQRVRLREKIGEATFVDLDAGYLASNSGGPAWVVDGTDDAVVTLRGVAIGQHDLRITDVDDGSLMDKKTFRADEVATISVVPTQLEGASLPIAFLPGTVRFGIGLRNAAGSRLVDEDLTIELFAGASRIEWDTFQLLDATVGSFPVDVTAAGKAPVTTNLVIVAAVEALVADAPEMPLVVGETAFVCFDAVADGHHVAGLTWELASDNGTASSFLSENCAALQPATAGELTITATAGGIEGNLTLPVEAAPAKPSATPAPQPGRAGQRAWLGTVTGAASRSR